MLWLAAERLLTLVQQHTHTHTDTYIYTYKYFSMYLSKYLRKKDYHVPRLLETLKHCCALKCY